MEHSDIDWDGLLALRQRFLHEARGKNYWDSERLMYSYDMTFAARIGWKWDAVFEEMMARRVDFHATDKVIDWACGTGVAGRQFLFRFPQFRNSEFFLFDQSLSVQEFARKRLSALYPELKIQIADSETVQKSINDATVLISHVLNELNEGQIVELISQLKPAQNIIWVESATGEVARRLVKIREMLRENFFVAAPCTHQETCGMLAEANRQHWCHHFARAPINAFTDSHWTHFSKRMEIDLRSLPYSFFVLQKKGTEEKTATVAWKDRMIGRPREYKGFMKILSCAEKGVHEYLFQEREDKSLYKRISKGKSSPLFNWKFRDGKIVGEE